MGDVELSNGGRSKRPPIGDFTRERVIAGRTAEARRLYRALLEARVEADRDRLIDDGLYDDAVRGIEAELSHATVVTDQLELEGVPRHKARPIVCYLVRGERVTLELTADDPAFVVIGDGEATVTLDAQPDDGTKLFVGGSITAWIAGSGRVLIEDDASAEVDGVGVYGHGRARLVVINAPFVNMTDSSSADIHDVDRLYLSRCAQADVRGRVGEEVTADADCRLVIGGHEVDDRWLRVDDTGSLRPVGWP